MSKITVYSFRYYDAENDIMKLGSGKCTRDKINSMEWTAIESSAEEIDSSMLNDTERYHPPQ